MKKPAFEGRASSVTCKTILAPSCLVVDSAVAHLHLDLLHKKEEKTNLRAITYKGGDLSAREGLFSNLDKFSQYNAEGRGVYLVVNNGGTSDNQITECVAFFVEWDNIPREKQLYIYKELNLPEPTFKLNTAGKSIHNYWVLEKPIAPEIWYPIQCRLVDYCDGDKRCKNPSRVMRLGGFYYIDKQRKPIGISKIIHVTGKEYSLEDITKVLPEPRVEKPRIKKEVTNTNWELNDVAEALDHIPRRIGDDNTYGYYRNIAWSLKSWLRDLGYSESLAIEMLEAHSPSKSCKWGITQIIRKGGEKITAGTLIHEAQKQGWRPKKKL